MHGYAHNRGTQNAPVERVSVLKYRDDKTVRIFLGFQSLDGLMLVRVKYFPRRFDALHAVLGNRIPKLFADQRDALAIFLVRRILVSLQRAIECIEHGNKIKDQPFDTAAPFLESIALRPLPEIFEIGLAADHGLQQLFLLCLEPLKFRGQGSFATHRWISGRGVGGSLRRIRLSLAANAINRYHFFFLAFRFRHVY